MSEKKLLLGDEALALGALHAGLSGVYAYPGTPSTEITEYIQSHPLTKERGIHCDWSSNRRRRWSPRLAFHIRENAPLCA